MSGFELMSHTKAVANKNAMICSGSAFLARKNSPSTNGVKTSTAPSFASTALKIALSKISATNALRVFMHKVEPKCALDSGFAVCESAQNFSTQKINHSKNPSPCKQKLMTISAMRVSALSQISAKITPKSRNSTSPSVSVAIAPKLEYTQMPSPKGRRKIPKSVRAKMIRASIWCSFSR